MARTLEENRAYMREWRAKNPEKAREAVRKWKAENPDKVNVYSKKWRDEHPNYDKEWRAENKEYDKERKKEYFSTLHGRAVHLLSAYNQADKRAGRGQGGLTVEQVEEIIQQPCAHCGKVGWDVIGLNRIDNSKPHSLDNVEPCCKSCNSRLNMIEVQAKRKQNSN